MISKHAIDILARAVDGMPMPKTGDTHRMRFTIVQLLCHAPPLVVIHTVEGASGPVEVVRTTEAGMSMLAAHAREVAGLGSDVEPAPAPKRAAWWKRALAWLARVDKRPPSASP